MQVASGSQPTQPSAESMLYLRLHRRFLSQLPKSHLDPLLPPLPNVDGHLTVISADLSAIKPYAGDSVDWLIEVANLLFDPDGNGSLYTFIKGKSSTWKGKNMDPSTWRRIEIGEELTGTIYEFRPFNDNPISLTRICERLQKSVTTNTTPEKPKEFRTALDHRDEVCIVTGTPRPFRLIASHLIPKRLGDAGIAEVARVFVKSPPPNVDRYHPMLGVLLSSALDALVDTFKMGFYKVGGSENTYIVHSFIGDDPYSTGISGVPVANIRCPVLHGTKITLSAHSETPLPPPGIFDWHYLQCVMGKFGSRGYKNIENIQYSTVPFHTMDDEEEDIPNDEDHGSDDAPYPTYWLDKLLSCEYERVEMAERHQAIANWRSNISTT